MNLFKALALLAGLLSLTPRAIHAEDAANPRYTAEDFVIGYWNGPPARFTTLERYREIRAANFTVAFPTPNVMTVEQNRTLLDLCQQLGMKAIIADYARMPHAIGGSAEREAAVDAIVKDFSDHPALLAYHIVDEPGAHAFPGLAEVVARLRERDPEHFGYINLLPTYARDFNALGTATYEEYVRAFVKTVKPAVLCYDHYHFKAGGDRPGFFENLDTVRRVALDSKIPFWNIVLVTQHFDYRHLTEPELRFEAMQTLAFGARGLIWFTYWSPAETDKTAEWQHALINADGTRDPHYDMVKAINADVLAIGRELKGTTSVSVFQVGEGAEIRSAEPAPVQLEGGKLTVGIFRGTSERTHFALVATRDYRHPTTTKLSLPTGATAVERFDPSKRSWSPVEQVGGVSSHELPPGAAVLLRWQTGG